MQEEQTTRRAFLCKAGLIGGGAALLSFGGLTGLAKASAESNSCTDTTADILNGALTAEQLAVTFYYSGLLAAQIGDLPAVADPDHNPYFKAALWEEFSHAALLTSVGAVSLAGTNPQFYFPRNTFENDRKFLHVLDALETAFIGAYTAAIGEWAGDSANAVNSTGGFTPAQLAKIAAQILGVEAEHRALGRDAGNLTPPNNLIFQRAPFECVGNPSMTDGTAVGALLPFVTGGEGFEGPIALPTDPQVREQARPFTHLIDPGLASP